MQRYIACGMRPRKGKQMIYNKNIKPNKPMNKQTFIVGGGSHNLYEAPEMEIVAVDAEFGMEASSDPTQTEDYENGIFEW